MSYSPLIFHYQQVHNPDHNANSTFELNVTKNVHGRMNFTQIIQNPIQFY